VNVLIQLLFLFVECNIHSGFLYCVMDISKFKTSKAYKR